MERTEHRGRKPRIKDISKLVYMLYKSNASFQEIADTLGLKSRQLARYHFLQYEKEMTKKYPRRLKRSGSSTKGQK